MLSFFPAPYPDELLYSVLGRYHLRSGNVSFRTTINDLFGVNNISAVVDLPSHLEQLCSRIAQNSHFTPEDLIYKNTLLPFYAPFLPLERLQLIISDMKGTKGNSIHMRTGVMGSSIKTTVYLRFCPQCSIENKNKFGEAYWYRLHQVSGVLICPMHKCLLKNSLVSTPINHNRQAFLLPTMDTIYCEPHYVDSSYFDHLLFLAENTCWLLSNIVKPFHLGYLQKYYLRLLKERDMAMPDGRIKVKDFSVAFEKYYGKGLLELLQCSISAEIKDTWLHKIIRKPRYSAHPLRHLLFLRYLGKNIKELFSNDLEHESEFMNCPDILVKKSLQIKCESPLRNNKKQRNTDLHHIREVKRAKWLEISCLHSELNRSRLRNLLPAIYIWLYRNDKEWFYRNLPPKQINSPSNKKRSNVDWNERDEQLLVLIEQAVYDIINKPGRPVRITASRIGKHIGKLSLLQRNLVRLPKCKKFIENKTETVGQFQSRKLQTISGFHKGT